MSPLLIAGFGRFGPYPVNPAELVVDRLRDLPGVVGAILPVSYQRASDSFAALLDRWQPRAAVVLGLAFDSEYIRFERLARNRDDCLGADADGEVRRDCPAVDGAPAILRTTLPAGRLARTLAAAGFPIAISGNAGGYVCNHLFYRARHLIDQHKLAIPMGLIHIPPLPEMLHGHPGRRGLALDRLDDAVRLILAELAGPPPGESP
ncbi:MAG: pyrrolidone-carboxylate peptidase [Azospirillum sp.]|nr:pyrrolidone-carboxylate peptidase [Azospirillum sp.]